MVSKSIVWASVIVALAIIGSVTVLSALDKDTTAIVQYIVPTLISAGTALFAANKADKAARSAAVTVENTNGRMREITEANVMLARAVAGDKEVNPGVED